MISLTEIFKGNKHKNKFLIHEHHADRVGLHYDIRIEHNGKLESWACRYVPDLIKGNKKKILSLKAKNKEIKFFIRYAQGSLTSLKQKEKLEEAKNGKSNKF